MRILHWIRSERSFQFFWSASTVLMHALTRLAHSRIHPADKDEKPVLWLVIAN